METDRTYTLSDFDYDLPKDLIAQYPARPKDSSRLMVLDVRDQSIIHDRFLYIDRYLPPDSLLVVNDTKVFHARLPSVRIKDGRFFEFLLLSPKKNDAWTWRVLVSPLKRIKIGDRFETCAYAFPFHFVRRSEDEGLIEFQRDFDPCQVMHRAGMPPLPPYIDRKVSHKDKRYYQTIYADKQGSSAAPTAGLHFTHRVLQKIRKKQIEKISITLHVGRGTFSPVRTEDLSAHPMHTEFLDVSRQASQALNAYAKKENRITAVGTTTIRALETIFDVSSFKFQAGSRETEIFIYPPAEVKSCRNMITNFHLPCSTLLMLVCAFGGYDFIMRAYQEALARNYCFYSYGDAMLILR